MSYSYYLIHGLALKLGFLALGFVLPSGYVSGTIYYWLWAPLFAFTLVVSFMLFIIIERPLSL